MCYFPLKCLKGIVFIGSICSIAISLGLLALTIYVQVEKKDIVSAASSGAVSGSLIALYITSIVFLLLGVAGLSGSMKGMSKKENKGTCLLGLFSIGVMVFFVVFLAGTIFFFVGPEAIFGTDCTSGSKTTLINDLYKTSDQAYTLLCSDKCPCNIKDTDSDLYKSAPPTFWTNGTNTKFEDCTNKTSNTENIQIIATLEKVLKCGGWCPMGDKQKDPLHFYYYRFRDINDCTSIACMSELTNCHDAFADFMTGKGRIVGIGCMIAMFICFLNIVAVCCICFHPSKVGRGSNFYSRMIQID